jgi:hypothetical protein
MSWRTGFDAVLKRAVIALALIAAACAEDGSTRGGASSNAGQGGSGGAHAGSGAQPAGASGAAGQTGGAGSAGAGRAGTDDASSGGAGGAGLGGASGASAGRGGTGGSTSDAGTREDAAVDAGDGSAPEPDCQGGKVVHFVYFVEADETFSEAQRADVEEQAFRFQQFWYDQLGVTFYLNHPVVDVIEADHDAEWYLSTPDGIHGSDDRWYRLGNVKNEVYEKLGIENFDDDHRVVNYPTTRHDGRVGGNFGGAWMDGDDLTCIADDGFNYPYDDGNSAHCTGHVAHEFGHVLGLDHEGPNDDCMQFGFYTDDPSDLCSFSDANVAKILADSDNEGWFEAEPGETCVGL